MTYPSTALIVTHFSTSLPLTATHHSICKYTTIFHTLKNNFSHPHPLPLPGAISSLNPPCASIKRWLMHNRSIASRFY